MDCNVQFLVLSSLLLLFDFADRPMTDDRLVPLVNDEIGDIILNISTKVRRISIMLLL